MRTVLLLALALAAGSAVAGSHTKPAAKPAARPPVERAVLPLPAADEAQVAAAAQAHYGAYACEFGQTLEVVPTPDHPGYADVLFAKRRYTTRPVLSATGALRLEDVGARALLVQIPFKSMLMDTVEGHRLVDGCVHEAQAQARASAVDAPPPPSLGIAPAAAR
jgi:hypothetical protein